MPSENNSHSILEDGKDYTLYASLKKKPYTLTVKIDGADESSTSVTIVTDSKSETCLQTDDACDFTVYAGENVSISYSAETDKFSYWKCSGDNCPVELTTSSPFTLQPISGNNTVTAKFNDKDKHCFYEDFSNLTAFCDNNEHCIRDCSEPSGCIVSGTTTVDWQLMQKDGSNTPAISSGFITTPAMNKGKQTFIMSTKQAGANGQMTSMLQTAVVREADRAEILSSLSCVDYVVLFDEKSPARLLENIKPNVYTKGADYTIETLPEREIVLKNNIRVEFIEFVDGKSLVTVSKLSSFQQTAYKKFACLKQGHIDTFEIFRFILRSLL